MEKCVNCGGEIKETTMTIKRETIHGKTIRVLNVPAESCECKDVQSTKFGFYHGLIIEDFVKSMVDSRDMVDFKEIEKEYKGISVMDIIEKNKRSE